MGAPACRVQSYTSEAELAALMRLAALVPPGGVALEIGSYLGASARYLAAGLARKGGRLYCVDTWQNETMPEGTRDTFAEFKRNVGPLERLIVPVRKRSSELTRADVPEPLSLVFIDGDHSYEATRNDFEIIRPMLRPDATVAFHDTNTFEGVSRVVGEALATGEWALYGQVWCLTWLRRPDWVGRSGPADAAKHVEVGAA
jgi:predicted O-methyltransferase YrrM